MITRENKGRERGERRFQGHTSLSYRRAHTLVGMGWGFGAPDLYGVDKPVSQSSTREASESTTQRGVCGSGRSTRQGTRRGNKGKGRACGCHDPRVDRDRREPAAVTKPKQNNEKESKQTNDKVHSQGPALFTFFQQHPLVFGRLPTSPLTPLGSPCAPRRRRTRTVPSRQGLRTYGRAPQPN